MGKSFEWGQTDNHDKKVERLSFAIYPQLWNLFPISFSIHYVGLARRTLYSYNLAKGLN